MFICINFLERVKAVQAPVGKEFPDMRQDERRIEFIRAGNTVRIAGWLKEESMPFMG